MLTISRRLTLSARKSTVRLYLQDLKNLAVFEPAVDSVNAGEPGDGQVPVSASGRFSVKAWGGDFAVVFDQDGGFHCELPIGPMTRIGLVYRLREVSGGTVLTHDVHYKFPLIFMPVLFLLKTWLAKRMEKKLWVIKEGVEGLERQIHLREIEAQDVVVPEKKKPRKAA